MTRATGQRAIGFTLLWLAGIAYGYGFLPSPVARASDAAPAKDSTNEPADGKAARAHRGRPGKRIPDRLKAGDPAPDFRLKTVDGKNTVRLSSFRSKKPVALIFGSYT